MMKINAPAGKRAKKYLRDVKRVHLKDMKEGNLIAESYIFALVHPAQPLALIV